MNAMTHTSLFLLSLIESSLTEEKDLKLNYKDMKMEKYVMKLCDLYLSLSLLVCRYSMIPVLLSLASVKVWSTQYQSRL